MALNVDPAIAATVKDIRYDASATSWLSVVYEGKNKVVVGAKGDGDFDEFKASLKDDAATFGFVRMVSGDQESKRVKFIFVVYLGPSMGMMSKSRVTIHKPVISEAIGQYHVDWFAEGLDDMDENEIRQKIKKSGGADYDLGSNSKGYESKAGAIQQTAKSSYKEKEKDTNIGPVVFETSAIPNTTACDLGGQEDGCSSHRGHAEH